MDGGGSDTIIESVVGLNITLQNQFELRVVPTLGICD
jgi:hypothetical protein